MESAVSMRAATPSDVFAIAEFQTAVWNEAYRGLVPESYLARTTAKVREQRWAERIATREILLAEGDGRVLGVASSSHRTDDVPGPRLELNSLYVARDARGIGLGERLLEGLLRGAPAVVWAFSANVRAIAFYERCGFALDGRSEPDPDTGLDQLRLTRQISRRS